MNTVTSLRKLIANNMREKIINKTGSINDAQIELQRYAIDAWSNFYQNENISKSFIDGSLSCFCTSEYEANGINAAQMLYGKEELGGTLLPSVL